LRLPAIIEEITVIQETTEIEKNDESKVINPIKEERELQITIQEGEK